MLILQILIATLVLWIAFIATAKVVGDAKSRDDLNLFQKAVVVIFVILDAAYNYTYGAILFWEWASNDRKLLTARLKNILHSGDYAETEWRFKLALFMCKYMISPFDWNHCGLGLGKK